MDLNFCTVCYQETNGDLYCGPACREADTPEGAYHFAVLGKASSSSPTATGLAAPAPPSASGFTGRFRSFSSSSEEEEEDLDDGGFQLPGMRNLAHIRAGMGNRGRLTREGNVVRGGRFGSASGRMQEEDVESEVFMHLTKPVSLEHRFKAEYKYRSPGAEDARMARYIMKKEFPGALF